MSFIYYPSRMFYFTQEQFSLLSINGKIHVVNIHYHLLFVDRCRSWFLRLKFYCIKFRSDAKNFKVKNFQVPKIFPDKKLLVLNSRVYSLGKHDFAIFLHLLDDQKRLFPNSDFPHDCTCYLSGSRCLSGSCRQCAAATVSNIKREGLFPPIGYRETRKVLNSKFQETESFWLIDLFDFVMAFSWGSRYEDFRSFMPQINYRID